MNPPLRIAVAGAGRAGLRRLRAVQAWPDTQIEFVAETDGAVRSALQLPAGIPCLDDPLAAMAARRLDVLIISIPPAFHERLILAALQAGIRHILVEKPMTCTAAAARHVLAAVREAGAHLKVGCNTRWFAEVVALGEQVTRGELGRIHEARFHIGHDGRALGKWAYDPAVAGGGTLLDNGVHVLDLALLWGLVPADAEVAAEIEWARPAIDRHASFRFVTPQCRLEFCSSWRRHDGRYLDIHLEGERGWARLQIGGPGSGLEVVVDGKPVALQMQPSGDSWVTDTHHFLAAVRGAGNSPAGPEHAAKVIALVEKVYQAQSVPQTQPEP